MLVNMLAYFMAENTFKHHDTVATHILGARFSRNIREAKHIDFVRERRHMDVCGRGGGLAPVTFLGEKIVESFDSLEKFFISCNHLYKVCKIQHFHKCIYILSIFVCSLSGPGLAPSEN